MLGEFFLGRVWICLEVLDLFGRFGFVWTIVDWRIGLSWDLIRVWEKLDFGLVFWIY